MNETPPVVHKFPAVTRRALLFANARMLFIVLTYCGSCGGNKEAGRKESNIEKYYRSFMRQRWRASAGRINFEQTNFHRKSSSFVLCWRAS